MTKNVEKTACEQSLMRYLISIQTESICFLTLHISVTKYSVIPYSYIQDLAVQKILKNVEKQHKF